MRLEQNQIDDYVGKVKEVPLINNRYHQIVDKAQRILFVQSKDINWEANVWYLERFQFDAARYDPTRPVKRISFLDILDKDNREYLKMYVKYQLGVTSYSVKNIWARVYITKAFLRFLDKEELKVEKLTATEIDRYMRLLQEEDVEIITFNDKVAEIHCFFRFLTARGYYSKVPFYWEYYMKREGYYLKEGVAWLRIYQHKLKMEKVIPIPMVLYRIVMVYIGRKEIGLDSYVFQNSKGGPYFSTHYWHEMVKWCNELGIRFRQSGNFLDISMKI